MSLNAFFPKYQPYAEAHHNIYLVDGFVIIEFVLKRRFMSHKIEEAECPECGAPHEVVRPGKTQPTCICHLICDACGGRIVYHSHGENPKYPNMGGEWCEKCGPFRGKYE